SATDAPHKTVTSKTPKTKSAAARKTSKSTKTSARRNVKKSSFAREGLAAAPRSKSADPTSGLSLSGGAAWPCFLGANRDNISREKGLLHAWPAEGPNLVWHTPGLGQGYSTVS